MGTLVDEGGPVEVDVLTLRVIELHLDAVHLGLRVAQVHLPDERFVGELGVVAWPRRGEGRGLTVLGRDVHLGPCLLRADRGVEAGAEARAGLRGLRATLADQRGHVCIAHRLARQVYVREERPLSVARVEEVQLLLCVRGGLLLRVQVLYVPLELLARDRILRLEGGGALALDGRVLAQAGAPPHVHPVLKQVFAVCLADGRLDTVKVFVLSVALALEAADLLLAALDAGRPEAVSRPEERTLAGLRDLPVALRDAERRDGLGLGAGGAALLGVRTRLALLGVVDVVAEFDGARGGLLLDRHLHGLVVVHRVEIVLDRVKRLVQRLSVLVLH